MAHRAAASANTHPGSAPLPAVSQERGCPWRQGKPRSRVRCVPVVPHVASTSLARVLRADGTVYLQDVGPPANPIAAVLASGVRRFEETADHLAGALPELRAAAGCAEVTVRGRWIIALAH